MKNSLNRVLTALEDITDSETGECDCNAGTIAQLQYEASRIKDNLIQLLTLYRQDTGIYQPRFTTVSIREMLEDCWLNNKPLMDRNNLNCTLDCDEQLNWSLDRMLVESLLDNVVTNTVRYTRSQILLRATLEKGQLWLQIDDDGDGYPKEMIGRRALSDSAMPDRRLGRTGIGLHFCAVVAHCHAHGQEHGYIQLSNDGILGGGRFLLVLPNLTTSHV
jgi:signal transduction histidine kinase